VPGSENSFLIVERGHFVANGADIPAGASVPTGSVLTIVVDATTGKITDDGVQDWVPNLTQLGHVTTDYQAAP
jgi:hypothetical protein